MNSNLDREEEILEKAFKAFKDSLKHFEIKMTKEFGSEIVEIKFSRNEETINKQYAVEIKSRPLASTIGQLLLMQNKMSEKLLFIASFIPPNIAEKLRSLDISFFDMSGNVYFNEPEFYIFVNTQRRDTEIQRVKTSIIFEPSGLQLLFVLLSIPNSENKTYRELVEISGVSLGTVSEVMNTLQKEYYLAKDKGKRKLFRKDELLKRWVQGYGEKLLPKIRSIEFSASEDDWWENADLSETKSCWGGEFAAALMTGYLKPKEIIIYTKGWGLITRKYKLRRENGGDIKIARKFWNFDENNTIAPPLLVYADLITTAKARNIETAQLIYDQYLYGLIE